jgi:cystathionine beta-lyase/cystathionine gamma-synthase
VRQTGVGSDAVRGILANPTPINLRMEQHCHNAEVVAKFLRTLETPNYGIKKCCYPLIPMACKGSSQNHGENR